MKFNPRYKLRTVANEKVILVQGVAGKVKSKVVALNETSAMLWDMFQGRDFTLEEVAEALTNAFDVSPEVAQADAAAWVRQMAECHIII